MSGPKVLVFPGASLMDITPISSGVRVRCPGCGAVQVFATATAGQPQLGAFVHEDGCAVYARIQTAVRRYEREVVRRG